MNAEKLELLAENQGHPYRNAQPLPRRRAILVNAQDHTKSNPLNDITSIGRASENDIVVPYSYLEVSEQHAFIFYDHLQKKYFLMPLRKDRTSVKDKRFLEKKIGLTGKLELEDGDMISLGNKSHFGCEHPILSLSSIYCNCYSISGYSYFFREIEKGGKNEC